jgi:phosphoribosylpyrophosphate synthetase
LTLNVYSWGAYAAYDHTVTPYRQEDFSVNCMVRAIKGTLSAKQFALVTAPDRATYRITAGSESLAFNVFGQWGASVLRQWTNTILVPVPSSSHTTLGIPFTGSRLADAIAARFPKEANVVSAPILAFKTKMPRASAGESGGRDKVALQNGLICGVESLSGQSAVLVDDVCTSGAHLVACAEFLRARGAIVGTALCLARTVNSQHPTPLQLAPKDVEAESGFFDL